MTKKNEYDGWGFNIEEQTVDIFVKGLKNPVFTMSMGYLLELAGFTKRKKRNKK